jgi:hypothetical protein
MCDLEGEVSCYFVSWSIAPFCNGADGLVAFCVVL